MHEADGPHRGVQALAAGNPRPQRNEVTSGSLNHLRNSLVAESSSQQVRQLVAAGVGLLVDGRRHAVDEGEVVKRDGAGQLLEPEEARERLGLVVLAGHRRRNQHDERQGLISGLELLEQAADLEQCIEAARRVGAKTGRDDDHPRLLGRRAQPGRLPGGHEPFAQLVGLSLADLEPVGTIGRRGGLDEPPHHRLGRRVEAPEDGRARRHSTHFPLT